MAFRKFDTGTWNDPWFEKLSVEAKLLFIYLFSNSTCTPSGMYWITAKRIRFETGLDIEKYSSELKSKILWDSKNEFVWVKNFFRHQCQNAKFVLAALSSLKSYPEKYQEMFMLYNKSTLIRYGIDSSLYHTDTISIPYPTEAEAEAEKETEAEAEAEAEAECRHGANVAPCLTGTAPPIITLTLNDKSEYPIYEMQVEQWSELFPAVDVKQELRKMKAWIIANPKKRKTKNGILQFINNWLSKEQDAGKRSPPRSASHKNYDTGADFFSTAL